MALCGKSNYPLNLITGWASLSNNNCNQAFAITGNESFIALWRNNWATLKGFQAGTPYLKVMPELLNMIQVRTLCNFYTRCNGIHTLSKNVYFYLVSPKSIFPKVTRIIKMFSGKTETSLCSFCSAFILFLHLGTLPCRPFLSLSYGGMTNTDPHWHWPLNQGKKHEALWMML